MRGTHLLPFCFMRSHYPLPVKCAQMFLFDNLSYSYRLFIELIGYCDTK